MAKKSPKAAPVLSPLAALCSTIEGNVGAGSVMYKDIGKSINVETFPSGVAGIDVAFGRGVPIGRIIEIFGPESGGKTTTCLSIMKACQQHQFTNRNRKGQVAFIDAEHALDPTWAAQIGVKMEDLILSQPDSGEQIFKIIEALVTSELIDLIVVDSVASIVPQAVLDATVDDNQMAALARLMSKGLSKLKGLASKHKTTIIFINQLREKVGIVFGSPEVTPGGRALKFYASIRAEIKKDGKMMVGDKQIGFDTKFNVYKNKLEPPFVESQYSIRFGNDGEGVYGIDSVSSLFNIAVAKDIIAKSGNFYSFKEARLGNGAANAVRTIRSNQSLEEEIAAQVRIVATPPVITVLDDDGDDVTDLVDPLLDPDPDLDLGLELVESKKTDDQNIEVHEDVDS